MKFVHSVLPVAAMALVVLAARPAAASPSFQDSSTGRQIALGTGSGLASIVYTPAKFIYAGVATITGGLVLAFTAGQAEDTASRVVRRGTMGDWWVHPDVFTGYRDLHFNGPAD